VTAQNLIIDLRLYITNLKGEACPTRLQAAYTLESLVDMFALITWRISSTYMYEKFFEDEIQ
jgi:hypothetical protein